MKMSDRVISLDGEGLFTGTVVERDSRVTVIVEGEDGEVRTHLRNTGRLKRLIYPDAPSDRGLKHVRELT